MRGVVCGTTMVASSGMWIVLFTKVAIAKCVSPQAATLLF